MTASPLEARCSVTPLEALRRLIAVAKTADGMGFESMADWVAFERELSVAEMVVRDTAPVAAQPVEAPRQPAPELREILRDALASGLTQTYGCSRVWSAWNVGTMTQDDFYPASECDEILDELCDLAITVLAAPQPAAQPSDDVVRDAARYREVRTWSARKFLDAWELSIAGKGKFDELVDAAIAQGRKA